VARVAGPGVLGLPGLLLFRLAGRALARERMEFLVALVGWSYLLVVFRDLNGSHAFHCFTSGGRLGKNWRNCAQGVIFITVFCSGRSRRNFNAIMGTNWGPAADFVLFQHYPGDFFFFFLRIP